MTDSVKKIRLTHAAQKNRRQPFMGASDQQVRAMLDAGFRVRSTSRGLRVLARA